MIRTELPMSRAFRGLQALVSHRADGRDALFFALRWMGAAQMVRAGNLTGVSTVDDLATHWAWDKVQQTGLCLTGSKLWLDLVAEDSINIAPQAVQVVKELVSDLGYEPWDVLPTLTDVAMNGRYGAVGMLSSEVSELMLDMLEEPNGTLWIPFDHWGVLAIRALRRGWSVNGVSMLPYAESALPLLLAIENGQPSTASLDSTAERDPDGLPLTKADCILANVPFGMTVRDSKLAKWDSSKGGSLDRYLRSETWAMRELVSRASKKAVFLVPPSVLFSRGQEERLREELLLRGSELNELHSVVGLPGGALSSSRLATALVTITPNYDNSDVLMVDLGMSRRALGDIDELVRSSREIALGQVEDENRACRVSREQIIATECSFTPSRYLGKKVNVGANAQPLEALCELIRPPVISKIGATEEYLEIGISDLKEWGKIGKKLEKVVRLRPVYGMPSLRSGDLVISIKGTIGKVGLVEPSEFSPVVVSQSCLGLRIQYNWREQVSPQYLLMYLRSVAGQAQLQSLRAGAAVQHISPQTLLGSFLVPVPQAQERTEVENDYQLLCNLEEQIDKIQKQMQEISLLRWTF